MNYIICVYQNYIYTCTYISKILVYDMVLCGPYHVKDQQHEEEHNDGEANEELDGDSECPEDEQEGIELLEIPEDTTNMDVQGPTTTTKNDKACDMEIEPEIDLGEAAKEESTEEIHQRKVG